MKEKDMTFLYIDKQTGTIGEADQLVLVGVEDTAAVLDGLSDSEIAGFAEDVAEDSTGIALTDAVALLREVAEKKGDWESTLDYVIQSLSE
jgi:hypothetical protein